jgi:hypothetical protein
MALIARWGSLVLSLALAAALLAWTGTGWLLAISASALGALLSQAAIAPSASPVPIRTRGRLRAA